jgi:magnesium transporter
MSVKFETAGDHVCTRVPVAAPDALVAAVRRDLLGQAYETASEVAVCEGDRLRGLVPLTRLLAADGVVPIGDLMDDQPPIVSSGLDQERAAWRAVARGESSLAVVDDAGRFLGLIPASRMLRVLLEEHAEDLARLGGYMHDTEAARQASVEPVGRRFRHRLPWLLLGLAGAMLAAVVVGSYEKDLTANVHLAFFLPGVVYMADAIGTQTETLVVRGLSVGVSIRRVVGQELLTGVIIGGVLAVIFFAFALPAYGELDVALAVSLSLLAASSIATLVAMALPWLLARFRRDPAFGSGPLATVVQDLLSIFVYFLVAGVLVS